MYVHHGSGNAGHISSVTGHLFHIDFGYILGRDPKPMPPPMKLTKEMVDAMGGPGSDQYKTFTDLCFSAFFHLRRSVATKTIFLCCF